MSSTSHYTHQHRSVYHYTTACIADDKPLCPGLHAAQLNTVVLSSSAAKVRCFALQAAAQQQKPQVAPASDADGEDSEPAASADTLATDTPSASSMAAAVAEKASAIAKRAPAQANKAVSKAAKQAEALKRKLGTPKARSVRKKGWKADAAQLVKSTKQWSLAHTAELGLAAVVAAMFCMVYVLVSSQSGPQSVS